MIKIDLTFFPTYRKIRHNIHFHQPQCCEKIATLQTGWSTAYLLRMIVEYERCRPQQWHQRICKCEYCKLMRERKRARQLYTPEAYEW